MIKVKDEINKLISEYKETEKCLNLGLDWSDDNDFARAKLEVIKVIINDLENLSKKAI